MTLPDPSQPSTSPGGDKTKTTPQAPAQPPGPLPDGLTPRERAMEAFGQLIEVMDTLRERCPWDREQTWASLRHLTLEETYELSQALLDNDPAQVKTEAGDLLLHLVFYARIAREHGHWDEADMITSLCAKLVRRHPHVYGNAEAGGSEDVVRRWEQIKQDEKASEAKTTKYEGVLSGVPTALPSMIKAMRIQEKARGAGFDWDTPEQVWDKVQEESKELHEAAAQHPRPDDQAPAHPDVIGEVGDLLFSVINYARFLGVNPDEALERTNRKFISRFTDMEQAAHEEGHRLSDLTLEQMDRYWEQAKDKE